MKNNFFLLVAVFMLILLLYFSYFFLQIDSDVRGIITFPYPKSNSLVDIDCNILPHFPKEPLNLEDLRLCHPREGRKHKIFDCEDFSCQKCIPPIKANNDLREAINKNIKTLTFNISEILAQNKIYSGDTVVLMVFNKGFSYLFENWACSAEKNNIEIKMKTLVIVFDLQTRNKLKNLGFMAYYLHFIQINQNASPGFSRGAHPTIMVLEHLIYNILIQLNFKVLFQDSDVVWNKNPLPMLEEMHPQADIQLMYDGRKDGIGPGNVGFIYMKPNCKTKIYMQTMVDNFKIFIWIGSSQLYINTLINLPIFRQLDVRLLDSKKFVNGHQWKLKKKILKNKDDLKNALVWHASWTESHLDKIKKFKQENQWYLTPECTLWNNSSLEKDVCEEIIKDTKIQFNCV